ncbi:DUF2510 domain-containing protein [Streptomyces sp. DW4-2]|uniref:DUF2510 domain-containing protein n=2 Tax=Streptomyces spirodelae TaxID=2812904 RepID=A0ABS3WS76_9ACTN|nr:DUF2510 domain-containing protein [Streptomyces spirodelae]
MSMTTPPGWYPDPGQTPQLPPQERWWDGTAWTSHTRPGAGTVTGTAGQPGPNGKGAGRGPLVAGILGAVVLTAALAVGGVLLLGGGSDEEKPEAARSSSSPDGSKGKGESAPPEDEDSPSDPPSDAPSPIPRVARDPLLGIGLTVPEGWQRANDHNAAALSKSAYRCPADSAGKKCVRGGGFIKETRGSWSDDDELRELTEAQVAKNAKASYPKKSYGGITSHKVVESGAVTVAGEKGYRVRWRVKNKLKPDAYVEAVVFRSPESSASTLVLWSSVDIADAEDASPVSVLDDLRKGVVATGTGQDEGPRKTV